MKNMVCCTPEPEEVKPEVKRPCRCGGTKFVEPKMKITDCCPPWCKCKGKQPCKKPCHRPCQKPQPAPCPPMKWHDCCSCCRCGEIHRANEPCGCGK